MEEDDDFQIDFDDDDGVVTSTQTGAISNDIFGELRADFRPTAQETAACELDGVSSAVPDLLRKMKQVDEQLNDANREIAQLMIACEVKRDMEQCISKREGRPVQCTITVEWLSSGLSIVRARLTSRSKHVLDDYILCISMLPLDDHYGADSNQPTTSRQVVLPSLPPDSSYDCEILCEDVLRLPYLVRCELWRKFVVDDGDCHTIGVRLDDHLLTIWDLVKERGRVHYIPSRLTNSVQPTTFQGSAESLSTVQLTLPETLVFLLTRGQATESNLLHWLLPSCSIAQNDAPNLTICGHFDVSLNASCQRVGSAFNLCLGFSDLIWKRKLLRALALRFSIFLRSTTRFPASVKDLPDAVRTFATELNSYLNSDDEDIDRLLQALLVAFPIT